MGWCWILKGSETKQNTGIYSKYYTQRCAMRARIHYYINMNGSVREIKLKIKLKVFGCSTSHAIEKNI